MPGERDNGRHEATPGDRLELIWEQEAAGSNPAIPTAFFEYALGHLSQGWQSASVASRRPAWLSICARWLPHARRPDLILRVYLGLSCRRHPRGRSDA
jgi:hypothetical protein